MRHDIHLTQIRRGARWRGRHRGICRTCFVFRRECTHEVSHHEYCQSGRQFDRRIPPPKAAATATSERGFHSSLGDEGAMPDLDGAIGWLNSAPLSRKSLRGKVVLVNFWTYTCINSIRPLPYLRNWAAKYKRCRLCSDRCAHAGVFVRARTGERRKCRAQFERYFSGRHRQQLYGSGNRLITNLGPPSISSTRKGEFATTTLGKAIMATSSAPSRNS